MRADAILQPPAMVTTSKSLESDPTMAQGLLPLDQVRRQVAAALFGPSEPVVQVGRFQVQKLLGTGGMGVVFAASDPQLGRTVALKLLQPLAAGERARERLLREAQAMARLQHPNVVGVHEAGVYGEQVYLVMEYVEDGTLADWLRVRARGWQEVAGVLAQAGEGLAAAHAAGLVHRDFKPTNILMGAGRARISDFGLARTAAMVEDIERTGEDDGMLLGAPLTRTGALLGTPAYMAPEQMRGEPATAASDQFAFGVVLYEALVGYRPFQGGSVAALLEAIEAGRIVAPLRKLPSGLLAIVRRALMPDPARRYPDMPALLTALRSVRDSRWRPLLPAAAGSAVVLAGGLLVVLSQPIAGLCGGEDLRGVWDDDQRVRVATVLADAGAAEVVAAIDGYAAGLQQLQAERCQAEAAVSQWIDTCLEDRRAALADLVEALAEAPAALHPGARAAVDMLPALADCAAPPKYSALVSEAAPDIRARVWERRLAIAPTFQPRVLTRPLRVLPTPGQAGFMSEAEREQLLDRRTVLESQFASSVRSLHPAPASAEPEENWALLGLGRMLGFKSQPIRAYDGVPALTRLGEEATGAGYADLAARAWVLAAELLEARPHAERDRQHIVAEAGQALGRLPADHPLRGLLQRDLAYLQLTHARHVTAAGGCVSGGLDLAACEPLFTATKSLAAIAAMADATPIDHELLARAYEYAGDMTAAATARGSAGAMVLDERTLGYLDFGAATVVPDGPTPESSIHCDVESTACEVDRAFLAGLQPDPSALFAGVRHMPSVKDGQYHGHKLYGIRPGDPVKLLGFKNGDLITGIDGAPVVEASFMTRIKDMLVRGDGTLEFERKGAQHHVRISIR